jgi:chromosomal replication initiator protein
MENIWEKVKAAIKELIPGHRYKMWIEPVEFKKAEEGTVVLSCPNFFTQKRVCDNYGSLIESEFNKISENPCKISIEILEKEESPKKRKINKSAKPDKPEKAAPDPQLRLPEANNPSSFGRLLRRDFTFDRFVVGENNSFAYSAALSVASGRHRGQSSLFLLSSTGMGKSHLSQAVGHHILSERPSERLYYVTAEDFMNEMVHAFRHDGFDKFKEKYRAQCDVLLLEDIHFLTGKERTQVELALALDYLLNADKKIIFTSCCAPAEIPKLNEQLRSRLSSGLISGIEPPDFRTRIKILQKKAQEQGYDLPRDIADYLASELMENVRQLESGLIGVTAKSSLLGRPIDIRLAESVVKNIVQQKTSLITIDAIKTLVSRHYKVSAEELVSRSRKKSIVWPRQLAIYLARKYTDQPLQVIGKSFNRYHATILHSIAAVEKGLKTDVAIRSQVEYLCRKLEA